MNGFCFMKILDDESKSKLSFPLNKENLTVRISHGSKGCNFDFSLIDLDFYYSSQKREPIQIYNVYTDLVVVS